MKRKCGLLKDKTPTRLIFFKIKIAEITIEPIMKWVSYTHTNLIAVIIESNIIQLTCFNRILKDLVPSSMWTKISSPGTEPSRESDITVLVISPLWSPSRLREPLVLCCCSFFKTKIIIIFSVISRIDIKNKINLLNHQYKHLSFDINFS